MLSMCVEHMNTNRMFLVGIRLDHHPSISCLLSEGPRGVPTPEEIHNLPVGRPRDTSSRKRPGGVLIRCPNHFSCRVSMCKESVSTACLGSSPSSSPGLSLLDCHIVINHRSDLAETLGRQNFGAIIAHHIWLYRK